MQEDLFSQSRKERQEIREVTNAAIEKGLNNANREWRAMAIECVRVICVQKPEFTMNDVRWLVDASPIKTQDKRAMGGVVKLAVASGMIAPTGRVIRSKVGHGVPLQIWKSLLFRKP